MINKRLVLTVITIFLGSISYSQKTNEPTLMERIQKQMKIPVIITLGDVKPEAFDPRFTGLGDNGVFLVRLTDNEIKTEAVNATFPNKIDSLTPLIVNELNSSFTSDKFIFDTIVKESTLQQTIQNSDHDVFVDVNFTASYIYDYFHQKPKRVKDPNNNQKSILVSKRSIRVCAYIRFVDSKGEKILSKILTLTSKKLFDNNYFINDANVLMKMKSPLILNNSFREHLPKTIKKLADKVEKKHAKALKKRK